MSSICSILANPDISGRGVLIAVYLQNFLCFFPAVWAIQDGEVTEYELDSVENHSTTNLILAFGILLSCIVQALGTKGLSNYHAAIILSMSWMNNTNAFVYFLLYIQNRSQEGPDSVAPRWSAWKRHIKDGVEGVLRPFKGFATRLSLRRSDAASAGPERSNLGDGIVNALKILFKRVVLVLGSVHLTVMAALGLWLWSAPQSFGTPDTDPGCAFDFAKLTILDLHVPFSSKFLRILSLMMYSLFLIPGLNLLVPMVVFLGLYLWHHSRYAGRVSLPSAATGTAKQPSEGTTHLHQAPSLHDRTPDPTLNRALKATLSKIIRSPTFPVYLGLGLLLLINVIFIVDIELTLRQNRDLQGRDSEESQWGFGQILAMLLLFMPLRDLVEAIYRRRQEMETKLNNALKKAIDAGDSKEIIRWINAGADATVRSDRKNWIALEAVSLSEDWHALEDIVSLNVEVNVPFRDGRTALEVASLAEQWGAVHSLLEAGADVNTFFRSDDSKTALHAACRLKGNTVVRWLVLRGVDPNSTLMGTSAFEIAILAGNREGAEIIASILSPGKTALELVTCMRNWELVRALVAEGADINISFSDQRTPLEVAYVANDLEGIRVVCDLGADVEKPFTTGQPAFDTAIAAENWESVHLLASVNGQTALEVASLTGRWAVVHDIVLKGQADANAPFQDGRTALEVAILAGEWLVVSCLIGANADIHRPFSGGSGTALRAACEKGSVETARLLLERGADPNVTGSEQADSCLHTACSGGRDDLVELLLDHGADPNLDDGNGKTALYTACLHAHVRCMRVLLERGARSNEDSVNMLRGHAVALYRNSEKTESVLELDGSIRLTREVLRHHPPGHAERVTSLKNLAASLYSRFKKVGSIDDIDETILLEKEVLANHPMGHPERINSIKSLAVSLHSHFEKSGLLLNLDEAIRLNREVLEQHPPGHAERANSLQNLAASLFSRFEEVGSMDDIDETIRLQREVLESHTPGHEAHIASLRALAVSLHLRSEKSLSITDMDEAIRMKREVLQHRPPGHTGRVGSLHNLAASLFSRFQRISSIDDLNEAISLAREMVELHPPGHEARAEHLGYLALFLRSSADKTGSATQRKEAEDLAEEAESFNQAT